MQKDLTSRLWQGLEQIAFIAYKERKIAIYLDDGVKVNYAKFQGIKVINSKGKEVKMDLLAKFYWVVVNAVESKLKKEYIDNDYN